MLVWSLERLIPSRRCRNGRDVVVELFADICRPTQMLQNLVFLHGQADVGGRNFCAVVTGPETAAGSTVDVKGHSIMLKPGKCSALMMGAGKP
jgi:hypothetical protein